MSLFEHNVKTVRLTEAGRIFLAEARAVIQRIAEAVQTVKAASRGEKGEFHWPRAQRSLYPNNAAASQAAQPKAL